MSKNIAEEIGKAISITIIALVCFAWWYWIIDLMVCYFKGLFHF